MENYKQFVKSLADTKSTQTFLNTDEEKMKVVMIEIFHHAKHFVRIFAGNLLCSATNSEEYVAALSDFIEGGGTVQILVNDFKEEGAKKSNLYKRLFFYSIQKEYKDKIFVHSTNSKLYMTQKNQSSSGKKKEGEDNKLFIHFAVGDNDSYRMEINTEDRFAICCMNDTKKAEDLVKIFNDIFTNKSTKINLSNLFE